MRFFLFVVILISCDRQSDGQFNPEEVVVVYKNYSKKSGLNENVNLKVDLKYPVFKSEKEMIVLSSLEREIKRNLLSFNDNFLVPTDVDSFYGLLEKTYNRILKDYPDYNEKWHIQRDVSVERINRQCISLEIKINDITGGSISPSFLYKRHYNPVDGKLISLGDLIKDEMKEKFKKLLEKKFRFVRKIQDGKTLAEAGFFNDSTGFYLNENFEVTNNRFTLYYNEGEIASFEQGNTELILEKNELIPFIKDDYKKVFLSIEN